MNFNLKPFIKATQLVGGFECSVFMESARCKNEFLLAQVL